MVDNLTIEAYKDRNKIKDCGYLMALPQVAILSNPWCAHNKKYMPLIRTVVARSKNIFHFELDEDATIPEALEQFSRTKPTLLIINGGDGTIHTALNFLINSKLFVEMPVLAVLATGRANKLAHDLGSDSSPYKVLEKLIKLAQVDSMDERIVEKSLIKLEVADGRDPFYGVYLKAGALEGQVAHYKAKFKSALLPKRLVSFFAHAMVFIRALGNSYKNKDSNVGYTPKSRIRLRGAGEVKIHLFAMLVTTLSILPSGRMPFGRFGNGSMGFAAVEYGFLSGWRAMVGLMFNKIGKKSILGIHTRRSGEIIMNGVRTITLDGEHIIVDPEADITINGDTTLKFISFKEPKA
jgi:hypothetical protein